MDGPATFLDRVGGSVNVIFKGTRVTFSSTRVKPAVLQAFSEDNIVEASGEEDADDPEDVDDEAVSPSLEKPTGDVSE
jgi:hypothetical protein